MVYGDSESSSVCWSLSSVSAEDSVSVQRSWSRWFRHGGQLRLSPFSSGALRTIIVRLVLIMRSHICSQYLHRMVEPG